MSFPDTLAAVNNAEAPGCGKSAHSEYTSVEDLHSRVASLEAFVRLLQHRVSSYERVFADNAVPAIVYAAELLAILEANASALALYGYTLEQIRSLSILDLFAPEVMRESLP